MAYTLNEELLRFLETRVRSLFAWSPPLGEDLTLERRDGSPMLITVTHERIAVLELHAGERVALAKSWPGLEAHTAPRPFRPGR